MAKKQNDKDFMSSQDFLGDLFKNVGKSTGKNLFEIEVNKGVYPTLKYLFYRDALS